MSFGVNAEAIIKCGKDIEGLSSKAETVKSDAEDANVPELSWGLLGQALTYSQYVELQADFLDHMDKMIEGIGLVADRLTGSGEHYRDQDKAVQDSLDKLADRLGATTIPTLRGGA